MYFAEDLGKSVYVRDRDRRDVTTSTFFTPGSTYLGQRGASATIIEDHPPDNTARGSSYPWTYSNVHAILMDPHHGIYAFVQSCLELRVMPPDDNYDADTMTKMAAEVSAKALRRQDVSPFERMWQKSPRPFRPESPASLSQWSVFSTGTPISARASLPEDMSHPELQLPVEMCTPEERYFYCSVVDKVLRRQIIHSYVLRRLHMDLH